MKTPINLAPKAYLVRGAFYSLWLLTVCVIPLALAQRNAAEWILAEPSHTWQFPATSNAGAASAIAVAAIPPVPTAPTVILYDQYDNPAPTPTPPAYGGVTSQDFEPELESYDSFAADDFVVPAGQIWNITEVDVIGESSEPPGPPIRSMFFSIRIAAGCRER